MEAGPGTRVTFVGREAESTAFTDALRAPSPSPSVQLICLSGPAGIGKTTLTERCTTDWSADGGRVAWTRCWNGPGTPALWPWRQLIEALVPDGDDEAELIASSSDRFAQFDAIAQSIAAVSASTPLTLVIDDLHWADTASLELLHFLGRDRRVSDTRIVATYRRPETRLGDTERIVNEIERDATVIELAGLSADNVVELAGSIGGPDVAPGFAIAVHQRTAGNPFFVAELIRVLHRSPDLDSTGVPDSIRSVVESHLALVDESTRQALELAAVQGHVFDADVVSAAAQLDTFDLDDMLQHADRAALVRRRTDGHQFAHALIGETLLERLDAHTVASHHVATAAGIEKLWGLQHPDHIESIANHLYSAGSIVPPDRLRDAALTAAAHAGKRLAWEAQSEQLSRVVDLLDREAEPDRELLIDVLIERCTAEKAMRRFDSAKATAHTAADLARATDDHLRLAAVALVFPPDTEGVELDQTRDHDQLRLRNEALALIPRDALALRCRLQAAHALSLYWSDADADTAHRHDSSRQRDQLTAEALRTAEELGDLDVLAAALKARIYATWGPDTETGRLELAERLVEVASEIGDTRLALEGRVWRISRLFATGRLGDVEIEIEQFDLDATRIRDRFHQWTAMRLRANLAFMRGQLETCERINGEALRFGRRFLPNDAALHFYSAALGPLQFVTGKMGDSVEYVGEMARQFPHLPSWRIGYAICAAEAGDLTTARSELEAVGANGFEMVPRDLDFLTSLTVAAAIAQQTGSSSIARDIAQHLRPFSGQMAIHGIGYTSYGCFDLALAQCADAAGDLESAAEFYGGAIEQLDPTGSPYAAYARLLRGQLLSARAPQRARRDFEEAVESYEHFDATRMVERARQALADLDSMSSVRLYEQGGSWLISRAGSGPLALSTLKGFRALQALVLSPHEHHHALTLAALLEGRDGSTTVKDAPLAVSDQDALAAYRVRVQTLSALAQDADARGDVEASELAHEELAALTDEITRARGFGGRLATEPSSASRARVNVTKHVKRAIERIGDVDVELGEHLRIAVSTGMHCSYAPERTSTIRWTR